MNDLAQKPPGGQSPPPGGGGNGSDDERAVASVIQMYTEMLAAFFPNVPLEALRKVSGVSFMESTALAKVIEDALPAAAACQQNPFWGFQVRHAADPTKVVTVSSPKIITEPDLAMMLRQLAILGLLSTPMVRAMARLYGMQFSFFQSKHEPGAAPKIILPG